MFKITYICNVNGKALQDFNISDVKLQTITHPVYEVAEMIAKTMRNQGIKARFWAKDGSLIF